MERNFRGGQAFPPPHLQQALCAAFLFAFQTGFQTDLFMERGNF